MIEESNGTVVLYDCSTLTCSPFVAAFVRYDRIAVEFDPWTFDVLGNSETNLVVITVPLIDTEVCHDPCICLSIPLCGEFTYVRVTDMAIIPSVCRRLDNLCTRLPYISVLRRNSLVQIYVVHDFKRIAVFADISVDYSILILDEARSIVIMSGTSAELISDLFRSDLRRLFAPARA